MAVCARWPHRDRVLQRRRARATSACTEGMRHEATSQPPVTPNGGRRKVRQARLRLHGGQHPGPRGPRGRAKAPGHVYRVDRRPGHHHLVWEVVHNSIDEAMAGQGHDDPRDGVRTDGVVIVQDDGRGVPVGKHSTGELSKSSTPCSTPAASSVAADTRCPVVSTAWGSVWSTPCPKWMRVEFGPRRLDRAQEYERGKPTGRVRKIGPQADDDELPRRPGDVRDDRARFRAHQPATPGVRLPDEGCLDALV